LAVDRFSAMKIFVRVAETRSFSEAARLLYMSAPAATRAVAALEDAIGTRLFVRTTREVKLTEAGRVYLEDCRRILAAVEASDSAAQHAHVAPSGVLTVTAPAMFGQIVVLPILLEYLDDQPNIIGRTVFINRVTNLVHEDIDVAVRIGHLPDSNYHAIPVGFVRNVICGTPAYFEAHGVPHKPADLSKHLVVAATSTLVAQEWRFGDPTYGMVVHPRLLCDTDHAAVAAVLAGWGITRMLAYKVASSLQSGALQTVLTDYEEPPVPVHVVHTEGQHAPAKARLFIDKLVSRLRENPLLN
jgi:DNA-binding transcriptional LysR family regulator